MPSTHITRLSAVCLFLLCGALTATAQELNWAQKMFDAQDHDFGVVAKGADVKHRFKVKNLYKETVHISNVRTTCGCSAAELSKYSLESLEEGYLEVSIDTRRFSREKTSSVVVTFDSPQYVEVRLPLKVYIRTDVVLTPGGVVFGSIDQGAGAERKVEIAYQGRADWKIQDVKSNNKGLTAHVEEKQRSGGHVEYELIVNLDPAAPVGGINDRLTLVTDDANSPYVPVLVTGQVEADVMVTPSVLAFGTMHSGESKTVNVVLRGKQPFTVEKIECESDKQAFRFKPAEGEKRVHVVPLTLTAPTEAGKFAEEFTVTIAGRPEPLHFQATAEIIAEAVATPTPTP